MQVFHPNGGSILTQNLDLERERGTENDVETTVEDDLGQSCAIELGSDGPYEGYSVKTNK